MKLINTKNSMLQDLKEHDLLTYNHSIRVANLSREFGDFLKLSNEAVEEIYQIGLYHDIGKLNIDSSVLSKKGKLNSAEYKQVLNHTIYGENILKEQGYSKYFLEAVRSHHENFNGTGYPDKLDYKDISLYSFILRLADSFDAMTSIRSYKESYSNDFALDEIQSLKGEWYHPFFADEFCNFIQSYK